MPNTEPVADGAPVAGWAPIVEDPAMEALLRPDAVLHRLATGATWAEGPVWLPHDGSVLWSDVVGNRVLRWDPDGRVSVFLDARRVRERPHARPRRLGRGLLARPSADRAPRARRHADPDRGPLPGHAVQLPERRRREVRRHDLVHRPAVRHHEQPRGSPGRLRDRGLPRVPVRPAHGRARRPDRLGRRANGLAFSPDETVLYVSDTSHASHDDGGGNHHIAAFDVVDGRRLANPRVFYAVDVWVPDGFRVDVEGNVWTSADDGIHVVAPDGRRLGRLPVPERTANCVFGGPGLDRLFITASTSLYVIDVATRGVVPAGRR